MKKIFTIAAALLMTASVWAQAPEKMSYQAVVRDASNSLITTQVVGMQISILQGGATGTPVYVETQTPTTNANGLVSLEIGTGTLVSGDFTTIDWANGPYFIKTETDPTGGTTYTITGTSQLMSVPYALYAKESGNSTPGPQGPAGIDGADGAVGPQGPAGNDGAVGATGTFQSGTVAGQMQYWNGTAWVSVTPGTTGQNLTNCNGVPTWTTGGACPSSTPNVTNATTGKIWMDRNLGASQVATSSTDAASYGDLYQWGRAADGHQIRTSGTTATLSASDQPAHDDFIKINSGNYDWRSPQNVNLWQGVNGVNNPCPSTYRLPTETEINAERLSWGTNNAAGAFGSPLKLPMSGNHLYSSGSLVNVGTHGYYWSSTVSGTNSRHLSFNSSAADMFPASRAYGFSVRCLKD